MPAAPPLARHTDQAEALLNGVRTFCALVAIGAWGISTQWTSCAAALTLASICCVLYSVSASPFRSLTLLMQTLVLLSLFSFVVKFGLMVQVTDLWQFLLFLFPLLTTMQLLKLQSAQIRRPVGAAYRLYGLVYRRHQPAGVRLCGLFQ